MTVDGDKSVPVPLVAVPPTPVVTSVYQPLVHLGTHEVVGYEALARGPQGSPSESPTRLFADARAAGRLDEVEWACRAAALQGALVADLRAGTTVLVNCEPEVTGRPPRHLWPLLARAADELRVVVELTERSLAWQPARLLRFVGWVRRMGWGLAVDDVGVDPSSLALVPLLRPDVVKVDMGVVHGRPDAAVAQVVTAVSAHAERTGATVVAEGIETPAHLATALGLGATVGQGWMLGRPAPLPAPRPAPVREVVRISTRPHVVDTGSVLDVVARQLPLQRAPKPLLQAMSRYLEQQALSCGPMTVVLSTVEDVRFLTPRTAARYQHLASTAALVALLGTGMPVEPAAGVRGGLLRPDDPLAVEWVVAVVSPHFAAALVARDLHDDGPDRERRFDYVLTYDRDLVVRVATALLRRVPGGEPAHAAAGGPPARRDGPGRPPGRDVSPEEAAEHLRSAFEDAPIGMAVLTAGGVVVRCNTALERLLGRPAADLVGHDLFGVTHEEDRAAAHAACASLAVVPTTTQRVRLLHADGTPVEVTVTTSRVGDAGDERAHLVMHLQDARAQRALEAQLEHRALHDPLTGLPHRGPFLERLERALQRSAQGGRPTSVLFVDLDGFKAVNDTLGHHAGDLVLVEVAHRVRAVLRPGDTAARWGGDEFAVLCEGADGGQAESIARRLGHEIARPLGVAGVDGAGTVVRAAVGVACSADLPAGTEGPDLVRRADDAMYLLKPGRPR